MFLMSEVPLYSHIVRLARIDLASPQLHEMTGYMKVALKALLSCNCVGVHATAGGKERSALASCGRGGGRRGDGTAES